MLLICGRVLSYHLSRQKRCWRRIYTKRTNFGIPNEINAVRFSAPRRALPASLVRPQSSFLDELCPQHELTLDRGRELRRRIAHDDHTDIGELMTQVALGQDPGGVARDLVDDAGRRTGRGHQAE